ncbi:MAG TPA: DUF2793 domain-containing protein [Allosphingosinicella sp.]|nr:DUF2793 domain-containing protein [Allosphingosinicella sp.]
MNEATPRFDLPFILPGQAQKEMFHNEALTRIDALLHAAVEGSRPAPPEAPADGECWIVESPAAGAWADREQMLAMWTGSGWRFVAPSEAMSVWNKASNMPWRWTSGGWAAAEVRASRLIVDGSQVVAKRQPGVPSPSGGTTIDAEARAAVDLLIVALRTHGLID